MVRSISESLLFNLQLLYWDHLLLCANGGERVWCRLPHTAALTQIPTIRVTPRAALQQNFEQIIGTLPWKLRKSFVWEKKIMAQSCNRTAAVRRQFQDSRCSSKFFSRFIQVYLFLIYFALRVTAVHPQESIHLVADCVCVCVCCV